MKIGLIIPANLKVSPYVDYYINIFKKHAIEYKIIIWNRLGIDEETDFSFDYPVIDSERNKILLGHFLFAKKCRKHIKEENFDMLIIFTIAPAFMLGSRLLKKYQGRFILDIRDDSPFRRRFPNYFERICTLAGKVVVSSFMYKKWMSCESMLCHNYSPLLLAECENLESRTFFSHPIKIVYAGIMIEEEINIQIINQLKNTDNFQMKYIGRTNPGKEKIEKFVLDNSIENVLFEGEYNKKDIAFIYHKDADLINIFRKNTLINRNALPNKMYDAVISGVPIVVFEHNTAIATYVEKYNLGIVIPDSSLDELEICINEELTKFDFSNYNLGRKEFIKLIKSDMDIFEATVLSMVR